MKSFFTLSFLFLLILLSGCDSSKRAQRLYGDSLFQHWVHSHEDDGAGYRVFRPAEYEFPPSRGREGFDIQKDGTFIHYRIGPADGLQEVVTSWEMKGKSTLGIAGTDDHESFELEIMEVEEDQLKVESK